jgi:midasin
LLSSYASAGKATVLREIHTQLYSLHGGYTIANDQEIVSINLADRSLDAKTLLGSLTSSPTEPGTFVFVEGTLTRALREGRWLVLEDIDKAADDVLSTIAELVEKIRNRVETFVGGAWGGAGEGSVGVFAGGRWIEAAEGFALFATRSIANTSSSSSEPSPVNFVGCQYWTQVSLDLPNLEETTQIVAGCYPRLNESIVDTLVGAWQLLATIANSPTGSSSGGMSRPIGMRALLVWCRRVQSRLPSDISITSIQQNPSFQEEVFLEACDVFFGSFPPQTTISVTKYSSMVTSLQDHLHLSSERVAWMLNGRAPELFTTNANNTLRIGRGCMPKVKIPQKSVQKRRQPYALTKPFLVLLEKLTVCTQLGEPVLMVGETGTGKTAAVGNLAYELGKELVALNLSNQTEASDLLGGFKPVNEAEELERELHLPSLPRRAVLMLNAKQIMLNNLPMNSPTCLLGLLVWPAMPSTQTQLLVLTRKSAGNAWLACGEKHTAWQAIVSKRHNGRPRLCKIPPGRSVKLALRV